MTSLDTLRSQIKHLERGGLSGELPAQAVGTDELDEALQGGLLLGALHEVGGPGALAFACHLLEARSGPIIWCQAPEERQVNRTEINPAALRQRGVDASRLMVVQGARFDNFLWAANEVLRSSFEGCVILSLTKPLDFDNARRLQLAAEAGGALVLVLTPPFTAREAFVPSAVTRWWVSHSGGRYAPAARLQPKKREVWHVITEDGEMQAHASFQQSAAASRPVPPVNLDLTRNRYGTLGQWQLPEAEPMRAAS